MPFQAVPDTASVTLFLVGQAGTDYQGVEAQVTRYVRDQVVAWDAGQLQQLADYMHNWFATGKNGGVGARTLLTGDWFENTVVARDLSQVGGLSAVNTGALQGTRAGDAVPAGVSVLVRFGMDPGAFPTEGRLFWPGGNNTDLLQNTWTSTYLDLVRVTMDDFTADIGDALAGGDVNWAEVRVSRSSGTEVPAVPKKVPVRRATAETNTLAGISVRALYAIQRDRRPGE